MRILIVDDSRPMRLIVRRALRKAELDNHQVEEAGGGVEALKILKTDPPDVVLCDWNMPDLNGIDVLERMPSDISTVFGFVTSEGTQVMKDRAIAAGARFFVSKPFTPDVLKAQLGEWLG